MIVPPLPKPTILSTLGRYGSQETTSDLTMISLCQFKSVLQLNRAILLSTHPCPSPQAAVSTSAAGALSSIRSLVQLTS